jgi:hypothetical protein
MTESIAVEAVRHSLLLLLDEIMTDVQGFVLDPGTTMLETLATVSADEASRPVSGQSANLAAQVNHVRVYIDALLAQSEDVDWPGSWTVGRVAESEWRDLIARLRASAEQARDFILTFDAWDENYLGGAIGLIAHCAYHLGEIRQGLGVIRQPFDPAKTPATI